MAQKLVEISFHSSGMSELVDLSEMYDDYPDFVDMLEDGWKIVNTSMCATGNRLHCLITLEKD